MGATRACACGLREVCEKLTDTASTDAIGILAAYVGAGLVVAAVPGNDSNGGGAGGDGVRVLGAAAATICVYSTRVDGNAERVC